jgi:hypothetical protein
MSQSGVNGVVHYYYYYYYSNPTCRIDNVPDWGQWGSTLLLLLL